MRSIQHQSVDTSQIGTAASNGQQNHNHPYDHDHLQLSRHLNLRAQSERNIKYNSQNYRSVKQKKNLISQSKLLNLNGSFLQFDESSGRLFDISKSIIKNPHKVITGEDKTHLTVVPSRHYF